MAKLAHTQGMIDLYKNHFNKFLIREKKETVKAVKAYPRLRYSRAKRLLVYKTISAKLVNNEALAKWECLLVEHIFMNTTCC